MGSRGRIQFGIRECRSGERVHHSYAYNECVHTYVHENNRTKRMQSLTSAAGHTQFILRKHATTSRISQPTPLINGNMHTHTTHARAHTHAQPHAKADLARRRREIRMQRLPRGYVYSRKFSKRQRAMRKLFRKFHVWVVFGRLPVMKLLLQGK